MGARIAASAVLGLIGLLLVVFGVGYLMYGLAMALTPALGVAGGAAVTGGIIVGPIFLWAIIILALRRQPPKPAPSARLNGTGSTAPPRVDPVLTGAYANFLGNKTLVGALLSRLRHQCHTVKIDGPSLRGGDG